MDNAFKKMYPIGSNPELYDDHVLSTPIGNLTVETQPCGTSETFDLTTFDANIVHCYFNNALASTLSLSNASPGQIIVVNLTVDVSTNHVVTFTDRIIRPDGMDTVTVNNWDHYITFIGIDDSQVTLIANDGGYTLS